MKNLIKKFIAKFLKIYDLKLIKQSFYEIVIKLPRSFFVYALLSKQKQEKVFDLLTKSRSQLGQDIFVSAHTDKSNKNSPIAKSKLLCLNTENNLSKYKSRAC